MDDNSENLLSVAIEIRELLRLLAEPAIAQRDEKLRAGVREVAGKSHAKRKAIFQMNGTRTQKEISQAVGIDQGDLSKLVKALRANGLINQGDNPRLTISLPANFFELEGGK
jgi:DNA-binding MarR family transcriptional regulator